jgi:hypothetical protein
MMKDRALAPGPWENGRMTLGPLRCTRRILGCALLLTLCLPGLAVGADEQAPRVAIKGYDPVAYFTPGKPSPGSTDISYDWEGARWQFASAAHRDLFRQDPDAYAPQYGGYCALGMVGGSRGQVDPEAWAIVDGKLYLYYERAARDEWRKNQAANIAAADRVWEAQRQRQAE